MKNYRTVNDESNAGIGRIIYHTRVNNDNKTCGECGSLDTSKINKKGEFYCRKFECEVSHNEHACSVIDPLN